MVNNRSYWNYLLMDRRLPMLRHHESATFVLSNSICNSQVAVVLPNIPFIGRSLFTFITMASCDIIIEPKCSCTSFVVLGYPLSNLHFATFAFQVCSFCRNTCSSITLTVHWAIGYFVWLAITVWFMILQWINDRAAES